MKVVFGTSFDSLDLNLISWIGHSTSGESLSFLNRFASVSGRSSTVGVSLILEFWLRGSSKTFFKLLFGSQIFHWNNWCTKTTIDWVRGGLEESDTGVLSVDLEWSYGNLGQSFTIKVDLIIFSES